MNTTMFLIQKFYELFNFDDAIFIKLKERIKNITIKKSSDSIGN